MASEVRQITGSQIVGRRGAKPCSRPGCSASMPGLPAQISRYREDAWVPRAFSDDLVMQAGKATFSQVRWGRTPENWLARMPGCAWCGSHQHPRSESTNRLAADEMDARSGRDRHEGIKFGSCTGRVTCHNSAISSGSRTVR